MAHPRPSHLLACYFILSLWVSLVTQTLLGTRVVIYCTVPTGSGTNTIGTITFDGQTSTVTRRTSSNAVYADLWYDSGPIANVKHTITIANGGSSSDSPLQLDRFHVEGDSILDSSPVAPVTAPKSTTSQPTPADNIPSKQASVSISISTTTVQHNPSGVSSSSSSSSSPSASLPSSTSSNSSERSSTQSSSSSASTTSTAGAGEKTVTAVQFITTAADGSVTTQFINPPTQQSAVGASSTPVGAIVGGVIGGLLLICIVILLLCLRRHRRSQGRPFLQLNRSNTSVTDDQILAVAPPRLTDVTPFHRVSQLEQPTEQQDTEMGEHPTAISTSLAPGHHVDPAARRLTEKNPVYSGSGQAQSPLNLDLYATNRLHTQYGDIFDHQTPTSMYASSVFTPPESSNNRPPSYQSAKPLGSTMLPSSPLHDEKHIPQQAHGS
ncbi:hypothetical protein CVT25_008121 [Psilocybe cyanescens]|uniref:Mid2 domain-containing protein n=1 Tax=Psilocybe cyanescens TaxID=93625 RepID=A0A409X9K7_PSICY|nr:hypothetical protein CVT25_008121 [Psilocybe cyanescens]